MKEQISCRVCNSTNLKFIKSLNNYNLFKCKDCKFEFLDYNINNVYNVFDDYNWTSTIAKLSDETIKSAENSLKQKISPFFTNFENIQMLDVGCGNGTYLIAAKNLGIKAVGTDVDETNINIAISNGYNAILGDIIDLDFGNLKFDFIHIKQVFHLVEKPNLFLNKINSLLKDDGLLFIDTNNQSGLFSMLRKLYNNKRYGQIQQPYHTNGYNLISFNNTLIANKFICLDFFTYSEGNNIYYPINNGNSTFKIFLLKNLGKYLDMFKLGGFIGTYAKKR